MYANRYKTIQNFKLKSPDASNSMIILERTVCQIYTTTANTRKATM